MRADVLWSRTIASAMSMSCRSITSGGSCWRSSSRNCWSSLACDCWKSARPEVVSATIPLDRTRSQAPVLGRLVLRLGAVQLGGPVAERSARLDFRCPRRLVRKRMRPGTELVPDSRAALAPGRVAGPGVAVQAAHGQAACTDPADGPQAGPAHRPVAVCTGPAGTPQMAAAHRQTAGTGPADGPRQAAPAHRQAAAGR